MQGRLDGRKLLSRKREKDKYEFLDLSFVFSTLFFSLSFKGLVDV